MARPKKIVVKDFGNFIVPEKWEDINLKQFQKIMKLYENTDNKPDLIDLISILTDKDKEEIKQLPMDFIDKIMVRLLFLNDPIKCSDSNNITIDGEEYIINHMEQLKFMEYVDVNTLLDHDRLNYAGILSILCRKKDEEYNDEYISNILPKRLEMFENQPVTNIMPLIGFFLLLSNSFETRLKSSLTEEKFQINLLLKDIESSLKNMGFRKYSMIYQMIRLKKLKRLVKNI
jgi:hypothetical protein